MNLAAPRKLSLETAALAGLVVLAALLFLWQLGSSSFFIDEAATMRVVHEPFSGLLPRLRVAENSPGGYFFLLHGWLLITGTTAEWVSRLPSALAAIALVPAVWRLGGLIAGRRVALLGALLVAVSPLVLQYAQQARAYTGSMLVLTLAVIGALTGVRRRSWPWIVAAALGCAAAISMHYATLGVVVPLCVWMLARRNVERRMRLVFCAVPAVALLAWLPLARLQHQHHPHSQLGDDGTFTAEHVVRVVGAPFDDRFSAGVSVLKVLAAIVVVYALVAVALRAFRKRDPELGLLVALVAFPIGALLLVSAAGTDVLNSRYVTFAVPFVAVLLAVAIARAAAPLALGALAVLLVTAFVGNVGSRRTAGFYPDTRGAAGSLAGRWRPGDVILSDTTLGVQVPLAWYVEQRIQQRPPVLYAVDPAVPGLLAARPRLWVVRQDPPPPAGTQPVPPGYRLAWSRSFAGSTRVRLELLTAGS